MPGSLEALASTFVVASIDLEPARELPIAGELRSQPDLEEIPIASDTRANIGRGRLRGFHVRNGNLRSEGLCAGDYLLVRPRERLRSSELVVTECMGTFSVRRVTGRRWTIATLVPPVPVPFRPLTTIVGGFAGIVRRQPTVPRAQSSNASDRLPLVPVSRRERLTGQLEMLEAIRERTCNPRLRRALRMEAERVRHQLRNEAGFN